MSLLDHMLDARQHPAFVELVAVINEPDLDKRRLALAEWRHRWLTITGSSFGAPAEDGPGEELIDRRVRQHQVRVAAGLAEPIAHADEVFETQRETEDGIIRVLTRMMLIRAKPREG